MATGEGANLGALSAALRQRHSAWRTTRAVFFLFNLHTLVVCGLTCAFTWLCSVKGWTYDVDAQIFVIGINFPLTFALTQAFTRRERALTFIAELKASCVGLFFAYRDWPQVFPPAAVPSARTTPSWPRTLGDNENPWAREARTVLVDFLAAVRDYLSAPCGFESVGEARLVAHQGHGNYLRELLFGGPSMSSFASSNSRARQRLLAPTASFIDRVRQQHRDHPGHDALTRAYGALSRLHVLNEHLSQAARYGRGGEGPISRCAQYVRFCSAQWEQLRVVKDYRTPFFLRWCCFVLVHLGCFALAPSFVHRGSCADWGPGDSHVGPYTRDGMCPAPYVNAIMYVCISLLLLNVQASAEHPFDAESVDDIFFELPDEMWEIATAGAGGGSGGEYGGAAGGPAADCFDGEGGAALFGPTAAAAREAGAEMARVAKEAAAGRRRGE